MHKLYFQVTNSSCFYVFVIVDIHAKVVWRVHMTANINTYWYGKHNGHQLTTVFTLVHCLLIKIITDIRSHYFIPEIAKKPFQ